MTQKHEYYYVCSDGAQIGIEVALTYAETLATGVVAFGGPEGTFALFGHSFDDEQTQLGVIVGEFLDAVEVMETYAQSDTLYGDFSIELRVIM